MSDFGDFERDPVPSGEPEQDPLRARVARESGSVILQIAGTFRPFTIAAGLMALCGGLGSHNPDVLLTGVGSSGGVLMLEYIARIVQARRQARGESTED